MAKPLHFPDLLLQAFQLLDEIAAHGTVIPALSLGGGTVLMFHYLHRRSKDIDIFVPGPSIKSITKTYINYPASASFASELEFFG